MGSPFQGRNHWERNKVNLGEGVRTLNSREARTLSCPPLCPQGTQYRAWHETELKNLNRCRCGKKECLPIAEWELLFGGFKSMFDHFLSLSLLMSTLTFVNQVFLICRSNINMVPITARLTQVAMKNVLTMLGTAPTHEFYYYSILVQHPVKQSQADLGQNLGHGTPNKSIYLPEPQFPHL